MCGCTETAFHTIIRIAAISIGTSSGVLKASQSDSIVRRAFYRAGAGLKTSWFGHVTQRKADLAEKHGAVVATEEPRHPRGADRRPGLQGEDVQQDDQQRIDGAVHPPIPEHREMERHCFCEGAEFLYQQHGLENRNGRQGTTARIVLQGGPRRPRLRC